MKCQFRRIVPQPAIWMEFMKAYIDGRPDKDEPPQFEAPGNIVFLTAGGIDEAFISGTQPGGLSRQQ